MNANESRLDFGGKTLSRLLLVKEVEKALCLGHTTVCRLIKDREIESLKIGSSRRVPEEAVKRFIERKLQETAQQRA